jgi:hypothetical protein
MQIDLSPALGHAAPMGASAEAQQTSSSWQRAALALLAAFLAYRLLLAQWLPLISDEAYGVVVSRVPSLSYFDHPPLAFGFARAAAWLFGTEAAFAVRLPHVLMGTLTGWMLFVVARRAFSAEAGFWTVGAYSVAPFFLASAGTFVVPDGPLNLFSLVALWLVLPALLGEAMSTRRWLAAGAAFGLALLSKYTAFLFGASVLYLLLASPAGRGQLSRPGPWLGGLVALACLTPVIWWNWQHDWISFAFHSNRASTGLNPVNFLLIQLGQAAFLLPWTWALALVALLVAVSAPGPQRVLAAMALPPIVIFGAIGLTSSEPLAHWAMPGFLMALPLVGHWCAGRLRAWRRARPAVLAASAVLTCTLGVAVAFQTSTGAPTRALGIEGRDFDWTFLDWSALRDDFAARGILDDPQAFVVGASWNDAGKSAYALGPAIPAAQPIFDPRHFPFGPDPRLDGRTRGYVVAPAWPGEGAAALSLLREHGAARFVEAGEPWIVTQSRGGAAVFEVVVLPVTPR